MAEELSGSRRKEKERKPLEQSVPNEKIDNSLNEKSNQEVLPEKSGNIDQSKNYDFNDFLSPNESIYNVQDGSIIDDATAGKNAVNESKDTKAVIKKRTAQPKKINSVDDSVDFEIDFGN